MTASEARRQMIVGAVIIAVSLTCFFAWGAAFRIFGGTIRLDVPTVGFFGWVVMGMFGVGYVYAGWRGGARTAIGFVATAAVALLLGILSGNYR